MAKRYTNEHDGAGGFPLSLLAVAYKYTVSSCKQYIIWACLIIQRMATRPTGTWFTSATTHVVWCPKYRRKVLHSGIDERLKQVVHDVCDEFESDLIELEIMPDHVHLFVEFDLQFGIHRLAKRITGKSSRALREEFPWLKSQMPSLWTNSYFVTTTGGAPLAAVKKYIENQKTI